MEKYKQLPPILEARQVTKRFGGLVAVNEVDFVLCQGSIMGLIGPNGAGKTTLFNTLSGVYTPNKGTIEFLGHDITGRPPYEICKLGVGRTFQITKPFGNLNVLENVMVGSFLRTSDPQAAEEQAREVLRTVGLEKRGLVIAKSLTIADRKRLELARALATQPQLLLLDEVMAGLNPSEIDQIVALLRQINASGVTLLIIEHVMSAIMRLCDFLVVLANGTKIAEGHPHDIAKNEKVIQAYLGEEYHHAVGSEA